MITVRELRRALMMSLVIASLSLLACQLGTGGSEGNFTFSDQTPDLEVDLRNEVDKSIAAGGRLKLQVKDSAGKAVSIAQAASDDEAVLKVVSTGEGVVVVEGVAPGAAELTVTDDFGTSDRIELDVAAIASTKVHVLPWTPLLALPERLFEGGFAILPDAPVEIFAEHRDASGQALGGFDAQPWSLSEGASASITERDASDFATLKAGPTPEAFSLLRGELALPFETVTEDTPKALQLYSQSQDVGPSGPDATLEIEAGRAHFMHVAAFLEDGRYLVGSGSTPIEITIGDDAVGILELGATPQSAAEEIEDDEQADDLARILANGRAFVLSAQNTGESTVTISWLGQSETFPVRVVAAP